MTSKQAGFGNLDEHRRKKMEEVRLRREQEERERQRRLDGAKKRCEKVADRFVDRAVRNGITITTKVGQRTGNFVLDSIRDKVEKEGELS